MGLLPAVVVTTQNATTKSRRHEERTKKTKPKYSSSCFRVFVAKDLATCQIAAPRTQCAKRSAPAVSGGLRPRVLHVFVEPVEAFGEHVQQRLTRRIAVRLVRQGHVADGGAMPFERHVKALGLD